MTGSRRGMGQGAALALALLLGGCVHTGTSSDTFSTFTTIDGPSDSINPLIGPKVEWQMESFVGKAEPHAVEHRLLVHVYTRVLFTAEERETAHYQFAFDDTAAPLKVVRIGAGTCPMGEPTCLRHETIAVMMADDTLRQRVLTGYRIKIASKEGEAEILTLSPKMIQKQLATVDNMIQGEAAAPAPAADMPHLGIGVVAATAAPFAAAPRGVIVVVTTPQSPAATAGVTPGDVLLAIDAQPIRVTGDIARILAGVSPRHAVTLELERGGKPFSATLQL